MIAGSRFRHLRMTLLSVGAMIALVIAALVGVFGTSSAAHASSGPLPCDIYGSAGTPCVAAHSTVRALYSAYNGSLYQVRRASDSSTANIGVTSTGGYANSAAQDSFCAGTSCIITLIYDQSPKHNDLRISPAGGAGGADVGANASALSVMVGGQKVYGVYVSPGTGYRDLSATGTATNGQAEGMYMVTSGTHVNNGCCFDYGNTEQPYANDTGNGHMDAVYFGNRCEHSPCSGSGPWIAADLENGLFQGNGSNTGDQTVNNTFVTALLKNNGQNTFALKTGNAQSGGLTTQYNGTLPNGGFSGYTPMHQEGGIVLGVGGDNSNGSAGSFFEGVMTSGYPTDAADNAVQANIAAVGYAPASGGGSLAGRYKIKNYNSGLLMAVNNMSQSDGAQITQWGDNGSADHLWTLVDAGNGYYKIVNYNSGKVATPSGWSTANDASIVQWTDNGTADHLWKFIDNGNGYYRILNNNSNKVATPLGWSSAPGTSIVQWDDNGTADHLWQLIPA